MIRHPRTGEILLRYDIQIENASRDGDNDLCMELARDQRDYYEFFGYGDYEERIEYLRRKEDSAKRFEERFGQ